MDLSRLEAQARELLDPTVYDYYAGGSDHELTLADNIDAWRRIRLRPRVLRDVSDVSTATTVLGTPVELPVLVAPMAAQRLADDEGEAATARAAAQAGTVMVVSTISTVSMEDVAAAAPEGARWFQLYVHRDRGLTKDLVVRAADAGYRALMLTVDVPVLSHRRREEAHHFTLPEGMEMANLAKAMPRVDGSGLDAYTGAEFDPAVTFDDIEWLRGLADLPVVVKGVLRGDDAAAALDAGAVAVVVSNHGGRQLDTAIASADALPDVVDAVAGRAEVLVDGGIRSGTDVVKALALGARAVSVGRPMLWGLAVGGADGVAGVLDSLREETERAMALCGASSVADIDADLLAGTLP
ncbi:MAG: alpha-hydroxy acid oxidase [Acidimicrobiia bacterium]